MSDAPIFAPGAARRGRGTAEAGTVLPARGDARSALNAADTRDPVRPSSVTENTTALLDPVPLKKGGDR